MAWFWPDRRIARWKEVIGMEHIRDVQAQKRGILLVGIHFLTLELRARQFGMQEPGIGVYRPNDNPLIDWLQTWGRLRSNKSMLDRKDLKGMIKALKKGEVVWYAPDHDYGPRSSVFVPLFAVEQAATTTGTWMLVRMSGACLVPFVPRRKPDGKGYQSIMLPPECSPPLDDAETTAAWMNKVAEKCIMMAPEQYMWLALSLWVNTPGRRPSPRYCLPCRMLQNGIRITVINPLDLAISSLDCAPWKSGA